MSKKWSEVEQNPQYQALSPDQKEQARQQYFNEVIVPQVTDKSKIDEVRQQFDADTKQSTQQVQPAQLQQQTQQPSFLESTLQGANVLAHTLLPNLSGIGSGLLKPVAEPIAQQVTGIVAKPVSDIAGLAQIPIHAAGLSQLTPEEAKTRQFETLQYQPTSAAAQSPYNPLNWVPNAISSLVEKISPDKPEDSASLRGAAANAIREGIPQMINVLGAKLAPTQKELALKQDILNKQKIMNAPTDNIRNLMQKPDAQGLKFITPSEKGMEAQYGALSSAVNPAISVVNEEAATRMAANEIGLPKDQPFTPETINAQVEKANQAYANLVNGAFGELPPKPSYVAGQYGGTKVANLQQTIRQTPEFRNAIEGEISRIKDIASGNESAFRSLKGAVPVLTDELKNLKQDPRSVLNRISMFRESAKSTFGKSSPTKIEVEQARAQMFIANQLENLLEQNLQAQGKGNLVPAMKEARTKLAQIHAVEDSLTVDGKVSIKKMAQIDKKTGGGLLTGNLKRIALMGEKYPLGAQEIKKPVTPLSYFDTILGTASLAAGHVEGMALVAGKAFAPVAARMGKLQTKTPEYVARPSAEKVAATTAGALTPAEIERKRRKAERAAK